MNKILVTMISGVFFLSVFSASAKSTDMDAECQALAGSKTEPGFTGNGIELAQINPEKAIPACEKAVARNDSPANLYRLTRALVKAKKYSKAMKSVKRAANKNYPPALSTLGFLYGNGLGVPKDFVKAKIWFSKAAELGDMSGQNNLGYLYGTGQGVKKDQKEAIKWFRKSAKQGYANAQYALGNIYFNGQGVEKDQKVAFQWFIKAAKQGYAGAQNYLGVMYGNGQGVKQDKKEAFTWYRKAAEQGDAAAQTNLGVMYDNGDGVKQDKNIAVTWYRKAAKQEYASAQKNLGVMYNNGQGVKKEYKEAIKWYRKAADQGYADAELNLGSMYFNGQGVKQDKKEAIKWYLKAAEQGNTIAQYMSGVMYASGDGVKQEEKKAAKWYHKAAEQGYAEAQYKLGLIYDKGQGVKKDNSTALKWFIKAAEQGDKKAINAVAILKEDVKFSEVQISKLEKPRTDIDYSKQSKILAATGLINTSRGEVAGEALRSLIAKDSAFNDELKFDENTYVYISKLPWNSDRLILVRGNWKWPRLVLAYYLTEEYELIRLKGKSDAIHRINKGYAPKFDTESSLEYLRFFTFMVHAEYGNFYLINRFTPISKVKETTIDINKIPSPECSLSENKTFLCTSIVWYQKKLFESKLKVLPSGMVELLSDEPVSELSLSSGWTLTVEQAKAKGEVFSEDLIPKNRYVLAKEAYKKGNFKTARNLWDDICANPRNLILAKGIACSTSGSMNEFGEGGNVDFEKALFAYERACLWDEKLWCTEFGRASYRYAGTFDENSENIKEKARAKELYKQASIWLRKAADKGNIRSQHTLGHIYYEGQGVNQDYKTAVKWFRMAAEQGDATAQKDLGILSENGQGVRQDYKAAVKWYRKAAEQGNAAAQNSLGGSYYVGQGVNQDYKAAVSWYRKAAEQGEAIAQYNLGRRYDNGEGVNQDNKAAVKWYRKAAEQGEANAQYSLGFRYYLGQGVRQNYKTAVKWFHKAAEQGHAAAQYSLGFAYYQGQGVKLDKKRAIQLFKKSAKQKDKNAISILRKLGVTK